MIAMNATLARLGGLQRYFLCLGLLVLMTHTGCGPRVFPKGTIERSVAEFKGFGKFDFSPDGKYFYCENAVRETSTWKVVADIPTNSEYPRHLWGSFSNDSKFLVVTLLGKADIYEVPSFKKVKTVDVQGAKAVCFTPDMKSLATIDSSGKIQRWSLDDKADEAGNAERSSPLQEVESKINLDAYDTFDISADGSLAAVANESRLKVYSTTDLSEVANLKLTFKSGIVTRLKILPEKRGVVVVTAAKVYLVPLQPDEPTVEFMSMPTIAHIAACWCESQKSILISIYADPGRLYVEFFDAQSAKLQGAKPVHDHHGSVGIIECSRDGKWLATNGRGASNPNMDVRIWNIEKSMSTLEK